MAAFGAWAQPVAASITAAATTGAAEIGASAQDRTNAANLKIARENNQAAVDLWREQRASDIEQWERENQYNSPAEQAKRLQEAGLSPLLAAGDSGNNPSFAGGQQPPALQSPVMQNPYGPAWQEGVAKAFDIQAYAKAYKDYQEGKGQSNQNIISGFQVDAYHEAALKGENPEMYKIGVMLETYNKMKKENKWIDPVTEATLKKISSETDMNKMFLKVRKEECRMYREQTRGLKLTNDFNAQSFPKQLIEIGERIKSIIQERENQTGLAQAQINAANASAKASEAQAGLIDEQAEGQKLQNIQNTLKAELAKVGINPDSANLPFFAGLGINLMQGKITAGEVSELFGFIAYADRVGWNRVAKSNADLTKYQMLGQKAGLFGSGVDVRDVMSTLKGMFMSSPANRTSPPPLPY